MYLASIVPTLTLPRREGCVFDINGITIYNAISSSPLPEGVGGGLDWAFKIFEICC